MFSPDPNDSFDPGKAIRTRAWADAQKRVSSYLDTAKVGGAGVDIFGQMRAKEIMNDANQYANQEGQQADLFGKVASFAEGAGSFGAAGGFDPSKSFMNGSIFGTTPIGAGGGTLPKLGLFGKETVGTLGPNYGIPQ
jgi:hypothetical protein